MNYFLTLIFLSTSLSLWAQNTTEEYPVDSASVEHAGVPKGEILKFTFDQSKIFPGTWREYWVYVPVQYDPQKPACVYINQDGIQWKAPTVFDNLIHQKEMPVTIGVFVTPGRVVAQNPDAALDRYNRSFEYDGLGDAYARFILEEILPEAEKQKTSDGRPIRLSKSGNDRAIGGSSSGAVCAFTAAWERPDAFSRVFSAIGTYVGLRGADRYPTLVRKYEPKALRLYMQDGENDLNIYAGDWWMANQMMWRALTFAGYEVTHQWGEGGHNGKQGTALFPDAMRYLWKEWPRPVQKGTSQNQMLGELLLPDADWEPVAKMPAGTATLTSNAAGKVLIQTHGPKPGTWEIQEGGTLTKTTGSQAKSDRTKYPIDAEIQAGGMALSPDHTQLYVTDLASHWVWVYQVQPDGALLHRQRYGWLHSPDGTQNPEAHTVVCDQEGRVYVATRLGVQVLDQTGRVNAILPLPATSTPVTDLAFGGPALSYLYVTSATQLYRRKLNTNGTNASGQPHKPTKPKL